MTDLRQASCVPCKGGIPPFTREEIAKLRPQAPAWELIEKDGIARITRAFTFKDFHAALAFTDQIGELAEREQHHPDIHLSYGKVVVETWTHKIKGLHTNDFILAAKIDALYEAARRT